MKKFIFLILAAAGYYSSFAQTGGVFSDKTNEDGSRLISSASVNCRNGMADRHPMLFAVSRFSMGNEIAWSLEVDFPDGVSFKIPQGACMLIKLADGSMIELKQTWPTNDTQDIVGKYQDMAKMRLYTMHGSYGVTEEQLSQIAKKGVAKIRVERQADTFDTEFKKNKVGEAVAAGYAAVLAAASQNSDVRSGF